jgi:hypothetical protein
MERPDTIRDKGRRPRIQSLETNKGGLAGIAARSGLLGVRNETTRPRDEEISKGKYKRNTQARAYMRDGISRKQQTISKAHSLKMPKKGV